MHFLHYAVFLFTLLLAANSTAAPAPPVQVTLFPSSALVTVEERSSLIALADGQSGVVLELPGQADPSSIRFTDSAFSVLDMQVRQISAADSPEITRMRTELEKVRLELANATGALRTLDSRIALWSKFDSATATAAELARIDKTMQQQLTKLYPQRYPLEKRQKKLQDTVKELEEALQQATGGIAPTTWQISMALDNAAGKTIPLRYSYVLHGANWRPTYRLTAKPDAKVIEFAYDATITQSSGMDWTNVQVSLATAPRSARLEPPHLSPWIIREKEPIMLDAMAEQAMMRPAPMSKSRMASSAVTRVERTAYMEWQLGPRTLPAGRTVTLPVTKENWQATFHHTVRPSKDPRAYLTAEVILPADRQLIRGEALFMADGAVLGKRPFSLAGKETTLFFGNDPLVTATMKMQTKLSGEEGFIGRKRTRSWAWTITCENRRNYPVMLTVEEPKPQARHEDITIEVQSTPAPVEEEQKLMWKQELAPQSEPTIIRHTVTASAPKTLDIDFGRFQ